MLAKYKQNQNRIKHWFAVFKISGNTKKFVCVEAYLIISLICFQRSYGVIKIIEDNFAQKYEEDLYKISDIYNAKTKSTITKLETQFMLRQEYFYIDPHLALLGIVLCVFLINVILRCLPVAPHPTNIYEFNGHSRAYYYYQRFFRALLLAYLFMLFAIGAFKLLTYYQIDCSKQF